MENANQIRIKFINSLSKIDDITEEGFKILLTEYKDKISKLNECKSFFFQVNQALTSFKLLYGVLTDESEFKIVKNEIYTASIEYFLTSEHTLENSFNKMLFIYKSGFLK